MAELHPSLRDYQLGARGSPSVETLGYCRIVPTGRTAPCSRTWGAKLEDSVDSPRNTETPNDMVSFNVSEASSDFVHDRRREFDITINAFHSMSFSKRFEAVNV
jgi:hypothetical protein